MAITTINLTDPVSTLITKTNTISTDLGDASTLFTQNNAVAAINALEPFSDSAKIISIARTGLFEDNTNGGGINLAYDSSSGKISITSNLVGGTGITYDSSVGNFSITNLGVDSAQLAALAVSSAKIADDAVIDGKIADSAVGSAELKTPVTLNIYDENGAIVKTLFGAGI